MSGVTVEDLLELWSDQERRLSCGGFDEHFRMGLSGHRVADAGMPPAPVVEDFNVLELP
jgi:hypothetical protein